jgi:predicted metal-dependent HD superfamily phosphohydrolase
MSTVAASALEKVAKLLVEDGWDVFEQRTRPGLLIHMHGEDGILSCHTRIDDGSYLTAQVAFPCRIKADRLDVVAAYVRQVNRGSDDRQLLLDADESIVALEASIDLHAEYLAPVRVRQMLVDLFSAADRHFDTLMQLVYGPPASLETLESFNSVRRMTAW